MLLCLNILVLLLLQLACSSPLTTPSRGCPICRGKHSQRQPSVEVNATTLALGEPCGVYTLSCAHGLRCAPPDNEPKPLRALLEGRGVCSNASSTSPTKPVHVAGKFQLTFCTWEKLWFNHWERNIMDLGVIEYLYYYFAIVGWDTILNITFISKVKCF